MKVQKKENRKSTQNIETSKDFLDKTAKAQKTKQNR
jgi:hypothetical protein